MKKIIAVLLSVIFFSSSSFAAKDSSKNWYFSSKNQNDRPSLPALDTSLGKAIGNDEKVLYLTFDAGYENGNVEKIVDILKEKEVTGAFFILKHFVEENPDLCKKMRENKNLICNHSLNHKNFAHLSDKEIESEILGLETLYREITEDELDPYFRPPEGAYTDKALEKTASLGYKTVFWSLAWADWDNNNQKSPEYAMNLLMSRVHNGAVILLHPTSETNTKILGRFIDAMKEKGYRFGTLEELCKE